MYQAIRTVNTTHQYFTYIFNPDHLHFEVDASANITFYHNNQRYILEQFHFHRPEEHTINNQAYVLEIHFVFTAAIDRIAVIALLVTLSSCTSDILANIINNQPISVSPVPLYWSYTGSLTTPPFNVEVVWLVNADTLCITATDLATLAALSKSARPLQKRNGRDIVFAQSPICCYCCSY